MIRMSPKEAKRLISTYYRYNPKTKKNELIIKPYRNKKLKEK
ncbi:hypothetical protein [Caminibacter pacificus]|uniref:Uncharacterized protein n=1 Tax=Caminibacter pacificus TaxID=1424653 RepID=A0AAJ4RB37_9BACT|nr:hypothetical protein [Caminibacter pacificus]ROR38725.1 hypothetical protein EDC58_1940 [Caminibacter pacificus]